MARYKKWDVRFVDEDIHVFGLYDKTRYGQIQESASILAALISDILRSETTAAGLPLLLWVKHSDVLG